MHCMSEILRTPTQTHYLEDDRIHQHEEETNKPPVSRSRLRASKRELNNLGLSNLPGRSELAPLQS